MTLDWSFGFAASLVIIPGSASPVALNLTCVTDRTTAATSDSVSEMLSEMDSNNGVAEVRRRREADTFRGTAEKKVVEEGERSGTKAATSVTTIVMRRTQGLIRPETLRTD